jgi:hypothetical protein
VEQLWQAAGSLQHLLTSICCIELAGEQPVTLTCCRRRQTTQQVACLLRSSQLPVLRLRLLLLLVMALLLPVLCW